MRIGNRVHRLSNCTIVNDLEWPLKVISVLSLGLLSVHSWRANGQVSCSNWCRTPWAITCHSIFVHNFEKCWPILKIPSLLDSSVHVQQGSCYISHRTLNVSLHYLVKYKKINKYISMYLTQYHRMIDLFLNISICAVPAPVGGPGGPGPPVGNSGPPNQDP